MRIPKSNIIVFGDIILDKYYKGNVNRISPEAPIPIVNMKQEEYILGGAANVAHNLIRLDSSVTISGCIGDDPDGETILSLLNEKGINTGLLLKSHLVSTISKARVVGNSQQIVRLDSNDHMEISDEQLDEIISKFIQVANQFDIVVLSDYDKGFLKPLFCKKIIGIARENNISVIVDPKGINWSKYKGASFITPNFNEIKNYLNIDIGNTDNEIEQYCKSLKERLNISNLLITRSEHGMTLVKENNSYVHFSASAKEVFDVSGAGDTVVATLAACLGKGQELSDAIKSANIAGGIVVAKMGTATVSMNEIEQAMNPLSDNKILSKIMDKQDLIDVANHWKAVGKKISFTNGCFDVLHRGHVYSLISAASFADKLIVAINSDVSVKRLKGPERPINKELDRAYVIAALECVDAVVVFPEETPEELIKCIRPDVLVKGSEYKEKEVSGYQYAGHVEIISNIEGYSTTNIVQRISKKN